MAKVKGNTRIINKAKIEDDNFIMSPKIDFAFKLLFGDPKNIDIEIQILPTEYMAERTMFYWGKMYIEQIKSGDSYDKLKKCITINILDFECTPLNKIHSSYHITEDESHYRLTEALEIRYLELPKLEKEDIEKDENAAITQWMEFIAAKSKEVMEMLAQKNEEIGKAYDELQVMSKNEKARMNYEAREAEIHDQMTRIKSAKEEGITIGIEKGIEKGENSKAIKVAENFLKMGFTVEEVAKGSELAIDKVLEIKKKMI